VDTNLATLVATSKRRWIIERDYEEPKKDLGLGHYEGRGWRGFHHHATLCNAAYGFLITERSRFPPQPALDSSNLPHPKLHPTGSPAGRAQRHTPRSIATLCILVPRVLAGRLPCCPLCCALRLQHSSTSQVPYFHSVAQKEESTTQSRSHVQPGHGGKPVMRILWSLTTQKCPAQATPDCSVAPAMPLVSAGVSEPTRNRMTPHEASRP